MRIARIHGGRLAGALFLALLSLAARSPARASSLSALWAERIKCVVAVEYFTETESERRETVAYGTVVDDRGTIILPSAAIDARVPPSQLKNFKVYVPDDPTGFPCVYLGQDAFTGWHFIRADVKARGRLVPVTAFAAKGPPPVPDLADEVWGIGLRTKDEDFMPYLLESHVALIQSLPQRTAIAQQEVAGPGLPVFNRDGVFIGLALSSFGQTYMLYSQMGRGGDPIILVDVEESSAFWLAEEAIPYFGRVPQNPNGRPFAWLGADGLEPMDPDVASFLKIAGQSGAVVSEVLEASPAEKSGMKDHDIIIAIDGRPLPRFRPDRVVTDYVDREVRRHQPGDVMSLTVLRGASRVELRVVLGDAPKLMREAQRQYFDGMGFTVREFVYGDAVERRIRASESGGVIVHYVKPNSAAALATLEPDDWIKEVDGTEIRTYSQAIGMLTSIAADPFRTECVLLVSREGDTTILRLKLK